MTYFLQPLYLRQIFFVIVISGLLSNSNIFAESGSPVANTTDNTVKSNQSKIVYFDDTWWGVFYHTSGGWAIFKLENDNWTVHATTGITSSKAYTDVCLNENSDELYVMGSTESSNNFSRFSYQSGAWVKDSGFPKSLAIDLANSDDPAAMAMAADEDLFIFSTGNDELQGLYSSNQGDSWTSFSINSNINSGLPDAIAFSYSGTGQMGVCVGQGSGDKETLFYRLPDNLSPTSSGNWIEETIPGSHVSDDHVCMVKDLSNNLYLAAKNGNSSPSFYLYNRKNNGSWSFKTLDASGSPSRPAVSIDEDNDKLVICAQISGKIQYVIQDKDNLSSVSDGDWLPILENGNDDFNNVTMSYQILGNQSDILIAASNEDDNSVWYNFLSDRDGSLPVSLAYFRASPLRDNIKLSWATYSEVDNWKWIIHRKEHQHQEFIPVYEVNGAGTTSAYMEYEYIDQNVESGKSYYYRLEQIDYSGAHEIFAEVVNSQITPLSFELNNNYPNPFNAVTSIEFTLGEDGFTTLELFNLLGQKVKTLISTEMTAGKYVARLNAEGLPGGTYYYRLKQGKTRDIKKMILAK